MIFAKAQLAREYKATHPSLNVDGRIYVQAGRHPLIDAHKVVPVSLRLEKDENLFLITGPNTGGKTVTLKLVGLFTLMAMSGLYVPAKQADLSIFDGVYSDIGDEQSIEQSLSTFSSHIRNTISILDVITSQSLVLFDELGARDGPRRRCRACGEHCGASSQSWLQIFHHVPLQRSERVCARHEGRSRGFYGVRRGNLFADFQAGYGGNRLVKRFGNRKKTRTI